jgi:hypothetical protein
LKTRKFPHTMMFLSACAASLWLYGHPVLKRHLLAFNFLSRSFKGWQKNAVTCFLQEQNIRIGKPSDFL